MKLVIDIPEEIITKIKDNAMFAPNIDSDIKWDITNAIVNGTSYVEQQTGEWERFEKCGMWHVLCRKCHHVYTVKYNFCPHCGEKKKGGEGND